VKKDLSLPAQAQKEETPKVADVTTHSPEAYRYYLEGVDYLYKYYFTEAEKSFKKALDLDSTFAMAYYQLAILKQGTEEEKKLISKAVEYSDKVSQKERYYIESLKANISGDYAQAIEKLKMIAHRYPEESNEAFGWIGAIFYAVLGNSDEGIRYLNKAIEIDPLDKLTYNMLAYAYNKVGDFEKSIWAINKYISIAPDEPNPYDSRADLYAWNGKIDQAIESYKKALEIKPDFYMSLAKLGYMYLFKKDYAQAESCFEVLSSSNEKLYRSGGRLCLAFIPLYQGKFEDALKVLDDGIAADRMEQAGEQNAGKYVFKALVYEEKKNLDLAFMEFEKAMEIMKRVDPVEVLRSQGFYIRLLLQNNDFKKAEEVAKALKKDIEEKDQSLMRVYWYAAGWIERAKGNLAASLTYFEKATQAEPTFSMHCLLAKVYLESGRVGEAVAMLEKALSRYDDDRVWATIRAVKAYQ
jgi:tetratricopeptide (TPR) repeat protein